MLTDTDFQTSDGARYTFDSQGIMRKMSSLKEDGTAKADGVW